MADLDRFLGNWKILDATRFYQSLSLVVIERRDENKARATFFRTDDPESQPALEVDLVHQESHLVGRKDWKGREFAFSIVPGPFRDLLNGASRPLFGSADDPDEVAGTWGAEDAGGHVGQECEQPRARASS